MWVFTFYRSMRCGPSEIDYHITLTVDIKTIKKKNIELPTVCYRIETRRNVRRIDRVIPTWTGWHGRVALHIMDTIFSERHGPVWTDRVITTWPSLGNNNDNGIRTCTSCTCSSEIMFTFRDAKKKNSKCYKINRTFWLRYPDGRELRENVLETVCCSLAVVDPTDLVNR